RLSGWSTGRLLPTSLTSSSSGHNPQARTFVLRLGFQHLEAIAPALALFLEGSVTLRERSIRHKVITGCGWALLRPCSEGLLFADDLLLDVDELIPSEHGQPPGFR